MIGIRRDGPALDALLAAERPNWLKRATQRNQQARRTGAYAGGDIWSEVKDILLRFQHGKCAYCETQVASGAGVLRVYDIEHYRPKNRVRAWPDEKAVARGVPGPRASGAADGYPGIAHALDNFLVSCQICNQEFKQDYFPIAGVAQVDLDPDHDPGHAREALDRHELPLLVNPLDHAPVEHLRFRGLVPMPMFGAAQSERVQVTIDLLALAWPGRESLFRERANELYKAFIEFVGAANGGAVDLLQRMQEASQPHAACVRSLLELCATDFAEAKRVFEWVRAYLLSAEGARWIEAQERPGDP